MPGYPGDTSLHPPKQVSTGTSQSHTENRQLTLYDGISVRHIYMHIFENMLFTDN